MGSKIFDRGTLGGGLYNVPNCFRCDSVAPSLVEATYAPEDQAGADVSRNGPLINSSFRPCWYRNGANMLCLPHQVGDHPMLLADLKISHSESHQFSASQSAPDEECENRSVTLSTQAVCLGLSK